MEVVADNFDILAVKELLAEFAKMSLQGCGRGGVAVGCSREGIATVLSRMSQRASGVSL